MMLPPPDDVLAHGTSETEEVLRWPSCAAPRVHIVHRGVVAQMKQLKVNFCAVELPRVVVRSLRNIQAARKELLPTTTNLPTAAAMAFQIKLREISLNEIRVIRARLRIETDRAMSSLANAVSDRRTKDASFRSCESKAHRICAGQRTNEGTSNPKIEFGDLKFSTN